MDRSYNSHSCCAHNIQKEMLKSFILIIMIPVLLIAGVGAQQNTKIIGIGEAGSNTDVKLECLNCHSIMTPDLVDQWRGSKHALDNVKCNVCHGEKTSEDFIAKPHKERCRACHADQVKTLSESKRNGIACGKCHSVHQFSSKMARETSTCASCHNIQWDLYNGSVMEKRGVQCSNCHFHKDYFSISNHSLRVVNQSCLGCHDSTKIEQMGAIQTQISGLLLEAKKGTDKQVAISIIENDGSLGFHNPKKANEMLTEPTKESAKTSLTKFLVGSGILFLIVLLLLLIKKGRDRR